MPPAPAPCCAKASRLRRCWAHWAAAPANPPARALVALDHAAGAHHGHPRFDTRFFVAQAPADQTALHDNEETTDSVWLAPRAALEQYRDGRIDLAPPQIMSLAHLARHASVASVLDAARRQPRPSSCPSRLTTTACACSATPATPCTRCASAPCPAPRGCTTTRAASPPKTGLRRCFADPRQFMGSTAVAWQCCTPRWRPLLLNL
jgi:hypothetical protein